MLYYLLSKTPAAWHRRIPTQPAGPMCTQKITAMISAVNSTCGAEAEPAAEAQAAAAAAAEDNTEAEAEAGRVHGDNHCGQPRKQKEMQKQRP